MNATLADRAARIPTFVVPVIAFVVLAALPLTSPARVVQLAALFGINVLLAQSINLLTGYAGQISLGQAALFGAGAYGSAVFSVQLGWPVPLSAIAGVVLAVVLGAIISIPAGRVREFYLAMVTFGLGLLAVEVMKQWSEVTGGLSGLGGIASPTLETLTIAGINLNLVIYFYLVLIVVSAVLWMVRNVVRSHVGRSFIAVSESELAASTLGINPSRQKRTAYLLSSALAGLAGVLYAHLVGFVSPAAFAADVSIAILVFAVLGGMRTVAGPVLGAAVLTFLPDQLHAFSEYQHLVYGIVLLLSFSLLPRGLAGLLPYRTSFTSRALGKGGVTEPAGEAERPAGRTTAGADQQVDLQIDALAKHFGGVKALDGVDLTVRRGTIHGLIGPNGSGKSTLLNTISGVYAPTHGDIAFHDDEIGGLSADQVARRGISRTFQHPLVLKDLTVRENVFVGGARHFSTGVLAALIRSSSTRRDENSVGAAVETALSRTGLEQHAEVLAGALPFGRQRMLELARSLCSAPSLLLLDEPAAGLAEADIVDLAQLLVELRDAGMTVVLVEHHMDFLLRLVDEVTVLDNGRVIFTGHPDQARLHPDVIAAYLGRGKTATEVRP